MKYKRLGSSGLKVSAIGLGTNQFGGKVNQKDTKEILSTAIGLGINFIDTADVYQGGNSEEAIGKALTKKKREKEWHEKLRLTHQIIKGTIIEIEPKALKIKTTLENVEMDLWFPKFSIIEGYNEEFNIFQEFMIKKRMLSSKRTEALHEKRYHDTPQTNR